MFTGVGKGGPTSFYCMPNKKSPQSRTMRLKLWWLIIAGISRKLENQGVNVQLMWSSSHKYSSFCLWSETLKPVRSDVKSKIDFMPSLWRPKYHTSFPRVNGQKVLLLLDNMHIDTILGVHILTDYGFFISVSGSYVFNKCQGENTNSRSLYIAASLVSLASLNWSVAM